ncbi:MAG: hypothetical protein ACKVG4_14215 [Longimicrobiales bacterium]
MQRNRIFGLRLLATSAAMLGVMFVAACDGENLFSVPGTAATGSQDDDTEAPTVQINSPRGDSLSAKPIGDSVFVSVHVTDDIGVRTVRFSGVSHRGDKNLGTDEVVPRFTDKTITLPDVVDTTLTRYILATEDSVNETVKILVEATDTFGNITTDSVDMILGQPEVDLLDVEDGQSVQAGLNFTARVVASDPLGITQIRLEVTGVFEATIVKSINPPADTAALDTVVAVPAGLTGEIQIRASARNSFDVSAGDGPLTLTVIPAGDTIAPRVKHVATARSLLEAQDIVSVTVSGSDDSQGGGVSVLGYTVLAISQTRADTIVRSDSVVFTPARTGTVATDFAFGVFNFDSLALPDTLVYEIISWARDADGNCATGVGADSLAAIACDTNGTATVADNRTGERLVRSIVAGETVLLPSGGRIMDAVVDTFRHTMLLSNIDRDRIEVFDLDSKDFRPSVAVGAAPWGLGLNNCYTANITANCGDTLIVSNSGGTNLSMVYLGPSTPGIGGEFEDTKRRLLTPDMLIFNAKLVETDQGDEWAVTALNEFSDRPQFLAMDEARQIHYSTWPTATGSERGTLRRAYIPGPGLLPEVVVHAFQFPGPAEENSYGLVNLDWAQWGQGVAFDMADHVIGTQTTITENVATADIAASVTALQGQGSDVVLWSNPFKMDDIGFGDTTFVSASGNGRIVLFGEGGVADGNRILIYDARTFTTRFGLFTADLQINKDDRISGLGVNQDGTLAMGRGSGAYFFTEDLRLQGEADLPGGGAGAALHPLHADALSLSNSGGEYRPDTHLAFLGSTSDATGAPTIEIYDTFHFFRSGRIYLRDAITGPMRASLPFAGDNLDSDGNPLQCATQDVLDQDDVKVGEAIEIFQNGDFANPWPLDGGAGGTEDRCVVLKLYGTTEATGVVVINVRKSDILREHPTRN